MAWGLEARVPFLDKSFLELAMNIDPKAKMFQKGPIRELDDDGHIKMEKVSSRILFYVHAVIGCVTTVHPSKSVRLFTRWQGIVTKSRPFYSLSKPTAIPSIFHFMASKGAVLGWSWLFLDRWVRIHLSKYEFELMFACLRLA